jgi:hypothetical protein
MPSTLTIRWVSGGPIEVASLKALKTAGHIIGLNGNWAVAVGALPEWHYLFSFIGPMEMSKHAFLNQLKATYRRLTTSW